MRGRVWLLGCALGIMVSFLGFAQCFGAGFAIWEGSARGNALGQAMVGRADDPSALFYNPAGITQLPGLQVMGGGSAISLSTDVRTPLGSQKTEDQWGFPPFGYVTYQYSDRLYFGVGLFTPFGLAVEFPQTWFGGFNSVDAEVRSLTINPNVAWKLTDQLSVAVGFEAVNFGVTLKQLIPNVRAPNPFDPVTALSTKLDGSSWGYGFNLAAHYKPCQFFSMGIAYRSEVRQDGTLGADLFAPNGALLAHTNAHTDLTLPDSLAFGLAFYPMKNLSWEVGAVWTRWSEFKQLQFAFDPPFPLPPVVTSVKNWHDTWRFTTGVEYKACTWLDLRAGYIFDQEGIPDERADYLLPSNDRHYFSLGPGFHWNRWSLDVSYTYIMVEDRDVPHSLSRGYIPLTSLRDGNANIIGASLGYKF